MGAPKGNKFALGNKGGRPPLYDNVGDFDIIIENYFDSTKTPTLAGLAFALGMSRQALYKYENKDEFVNSIKRAKQRIEAIYEERLIYEPNQTGVIFALKNYGWSDKRELEHSGVINLTFDKEDADL